MNQRIVFSSLVVLLMLSACNQSADRVRVYNYGDGRQTGVGSLGLHTYRKGETLWSISNAYHVDLRNLLDANSLHAPYRVTVGDRLRIPAPNLYKVQKDDTLYKISRMFDTTTTDLVSLNMLRAPYNLKVNQTLKIPVKHAPPPRVIKSLPTYAYFRNPTIRMAARELPQQSYSPPVTYNTRTPTQNDRPPSQQAIEREVLNPLPQQQPSQVAQNQTRTENTGSSSVTTTDHRPLELSKKGFLKPVSGRIISGYGTTSDGLHNDGINIKASRGDAVRSAEQGVVVYSGNQIEGYGNMLLIRHADGFMTAYAHMDKSLVKKGDRVSRGQAIGTVGATGRVNSPQLHFEIRKGKDAVNPSDYLNS